MKRALLNVSSIAFGEEKRKQTFLWTFSIEMGERKREREGTFIIGQSRNDPKIKLLFCGLAEDNRNADLKLLFFHGGGEN